MFGPPLCRFATRGTAHPGRSDLVLRLEWNALRRQAAVVDAHIMPEARQPLIRQLRPAFAPGLQ
ncbi:hypothetical protein ACFQU7_41665 [Pseudoroseomonas wenyumeiae]